LANWLLMSSNPPSIDELWDSAPVSNQTFDPALTRNLPAPAQRYLQHAIAMGTPLATAVHLRMHGEIKLKGWFPFSAEQVIRWDRGMLWRAAVRLHGIVMRGGDRFLDGQGAMQWKLLGIVPIVNASGPDITRSAAGRVNIESIWLPSVLCHDDVSWAVLDPCHLHAHFRAHGDTAEIDYTIDNQGRLQSVNMPRWGNPEGAQFHVANCGGFIEEERTFGGYTIPSRLRVGWYFGSERFESEGEFFRATIDDATYR
jgi:hypothetical protein